MMLGRDVNDVKCVSNANIVKHVPIFNDRICRDLSFGFIIKARACKGVGRK
jgi:hypothetical protein